MTTWEEVADFVRSGPDDRHFAWNSTTGEVRFGPLIRYPDGTSRQHGATRREGSLSWRPGTATAAAPPATSGRDARRHAHVAARTSIASRTSFGAIGGVDAETVDNAKRRGPHSLRAGGRAVTAEDFERLAAEADPAIARVRCLPPEQTGEPIRLLLVPHVERPGELLELDDFALTDDMVAASPATSTSAASSARPSRSARPTGEVGVALVTSGPGVTNAVTGIATAYMDSIPMVIITGQVPTPAIGLDAFQECDTVGITRPVVKHNFLVKDVSDLALTMKKAFHIARTGRPGPVVVDIPKDVSMHDGAVPLPERRRDALVQPGRARATAGRSGRRCSCCWRRSGPKVYTGGGVDPRQRLGRAARARRPARLPVHQHADGPRRATRRATRSSSACSACTAPTKRTWRCSTATCCSRSARASTTA